MLSPLVLTGKDVLSLPLLILIGRDFSFFKSLLVWIGMHFLPFPEGFEKPS